MSREEGRVTARERLAAALLAELRRLEPDLSFTRVAPDHAQTVARRQRAR
jgi:hypothetical protein